MDAFSTPDQNKITFRLQAAKSACSGRRCFVDKTLPNLNFSLASPANQLNCSLDGTPDIRSIVHQVSKSTGAKRKLADYAADSDSQPKRTKLEFPTSNVVPMYQDYQLLGDSQFVRFAEQMLSLRIKFIAKKRCIGYCVSGQKIEDLRTRIKGNVTAIHSQVVVLIGTNDIVYRTDYKLMCSSYKRLVEMLKKKCDKIILLTVPPVPKFEKCDWHWTGLKKLNKYIQGLADEKVTVLDLCSLFITFDNTANKDYYEEVYNAGPKLDQIHLNLKGFKLLKCILDIHLED